ncbi:MAG: hypothetical protein L6416_00550 [Candidatus Omnitrophica bacterium]|nr:hypothetical protein [Candidatus Omnitrophota bacterium]
MRILFVVSLLICTFFNPVFLFAQRKSGAVVKKVKMSKEEEISRQEADAINQELDAQIQKTNAEVEQIRLKAEDQALKDVEQAEKDLQVSIQEFQKEKFPEEIRREKSPEGQ